MGSRYDQLERLQRLRESGALSEAEFEAEKQRLLGHESPAEAAPDAPLIADAPPGGPPSPPSRRPLYIILGIAALIVAIAAGLFMGGLVGRQGEDSGAANSVFPVEENQVAEINLVEAPPAIDLKALPPEEQIGRAFEAAFGARDLGRLEVAAPADPDEPQAETYTETVRYTPGRLIWPSFGPVLISEGRVEGASHASAGKIAVHYLKEAGDRFEVVRGFPAAVVTGSSGEVERWSVTPRFSSWPVIAAEGGGTWQGCTSRWLTLTEIRPTGPVELVTVPLVYDNEGTGGRISVEGKLLNVIKDQAFDVVYAGSRAYSEHYVRQGNAYAPAGGAKPRLETC